MEHEKRAFAIDDFKIETREDGQAVIIGHAAVFNSPTTIYDFREQVAPGAFATAIKEDDVRALFNHDPNFVLGRNKSGTLRMSEDERGLRIEIDPPDTQFAKDLITSMERGDISQMSFAFSVRPNGQNWGEDEDGTMVRTLTDVRLYDVSPVTYPAYQDTDVSVAKRSMQDWKDQQKPTEPYKLNLAKRRLNLIERA